MSNTRDEIATQAARIAGTVNNIIPNLEDCIKHAHDAKPLEHKAWLTRVQQHVKRLQEEHQKLEQLVKAFKALKPGTVGDQKSGVKGIVQKLNPNAKGDKELLAKMDAALGDINVAIKNGEEMKIAPWTPIHLG